MRFDGERLMAATRGADGFSPIDIPEGERGGWRVEEEFVAAIRGTEPITHTDFATGYAIALSRVAGRAPLGRPFLTTL